MRRRRFLALAGTVSLAGCSGGEPTATTGSTPETDTPVAGAEPTAAPSPSGAATETRTTEPGTATEPAVDTERAEAALAAARDQLAEAVSTFEAEPVALGAVPDAFGYDNRLVTSTTAAAETRARTAVEVGDDGQVAAARAYLALAAGLRALADAHTALIGASEGVERAATETAEEQYAAAADTLSTATEMTAEARGSLGTARTRLRAFEEVVVDPALSEPVDADLTATLTVLVVVEVLVAGRRADARGLFRLEAGITDFRNDEYEAASEHFAAAFGRFEAAIDAREGYSGELLAETVAAERCLATEYRDATGTFQSAALEATAGNLSEAFDEYREALSAYRNAPDEC